LVSLQGLVLVKEPYVSFGYNLRQSYRITNFFRWFCEPAYEKLRGTPDATVNRSAADFPVAMSYTHHPTPFSRLYSEKAYILSRGFVSRALGTPLGGLEAEIKYFYHEQGRLQKVIDDANTLIHKSKNCQAVNDQAWETYAVPRLTAGGMIMLERILKKLVMAQAGTTVSQPCR
jgi:ubiquitin-conjugating enzyme E2 O